jgi:hypothetical protein
MRLLLLLCFCLSCFAGLAQINKGFLIVQEDTTCKNKFGFAFLNQNGDTITRLDTARYYMCFSDTIQYFAIVAICNKPGWWAIDRYEHVLFEVFNTSDGEPSPDELHEGMIRIVDSAGKIGFANYKGRVVIAPQFEAATSFKNGKAIIGKACKQVLWCCKGAHADKHYILQCTKTGYINTQGKIFAMGNLTLTQMKKKIGWPDDK